MYKIGDFYKKIFPYRTLRKIFNERQHDDIYHTSLNSVKIYEKITYVCSTI